MYANSDGQDLVKHLTAAMKMALHCADFLGVDDADLRNVIALSAFLHDIGKSTKYFQKITLRSQENGKPLFPMIREEYPDFSGKDNADYYPRHNELSWLYVSRHLSRRSPLKKTGLQAIYWHHATFQHKPLERTSQDIIDELNKFSKSELSEVENTITELIKSVSFPFDIEKYLDFDTDDSLCTVPKMFEHTEDTSDIDNAKRWVVRSCVMYSDHIVSSLSTEELDDLIENTADKYFPVNANVFNVEFPKPDSYEEGRFNLQKSIVEECGRTTIIKAPAGFGKSLIGVMWGTKQPGQIYWVCPRNTVAEGVYQNILQEIETFGLDISVELFLTSERKAATNENIRVCQSDIVVTNIDNLLAPMVSHGHVSRIFDVNARNIVLDEFHEFLNDEALFGAFVVYMKARNILCKNTKTVLLSATPAIFHELWDTAKNKTLLLPNEESHYPAQHDKPYTFSTNDCMVASPENGSLTMYSSIANVQEFYSHGYNVIIHSRYYDDDRKAIMSNIFANFGKGKAKQGMVISAPILQAAFDISFSKLYKTIESPECDIQTLGRVNRWGELDTSTVVLLDLHADKRERSAIVARYDLTISKLWAEFVRENFNNTLTLNEVYKLYNAFNLKYKREIFAFVSKRLSGALEKLETFYPKEKVSSKKSDKIISAKTLRNYGPSYFIVVKNKQTDQWSPSVFNFQEFETCDLITENRDRLEKASLNTVWDNLNAVQNSAGEYVFDFSELQKKFFGKKEKKKKFSADYLKQYARCSDTPIPIWSRAYDSVLGLV